MDFLKVFQTLENLIFDLFSIVVFWPITLYKTITSPINLIRKIDEDSTNEFKDIMAPVFFALISIITPFCMLHLFYQEIDLRMIMGNWLPNVSIPPIKNTSFTTPLLGIFFLFGSFLMALLLMIITKEEINKERLKKKFWHQCIIHTPLNLFFYFPIIISQLNIPDMVAIPLFIGILASLLWYWIVETVYIHKYLNQDLAIAMGITFSFFITNIFLFGYVGYILAYSSKLL